jgi:hypothetical protein
MFRWYPRTWLLHHHAALTSARHKAGLVVMEQMLRYINELHRLFPRIIRYIACYYRPNNRFAARTFGDAALSLRDRRQASLDDFAYFHLPRRSTPSVLPAGWSLTEAQTADRSALRESYLRRGGGLMLEGLALRDEDIAEEAALSREYSRLGFTRDRRLYALRRGGRCAAIIAANFSDLGLNLSDLTNGLQAFVLEPEELPVGVLLEALAALSSRSAAGQTTVLLHPKAYADERGIACDKEYMLGVLDLHYFTPYLDYIEGLISHEPAAAPRPSSDKLQR